MPPSRSNLLERNRETTTEVNMRQTKSIVSLRIQEERFFTDKWNVITCKSLCPLDLFQITLRWSHALIKIKKWKLPGSLWLRSFIWMHHLLYIDFDIILSNTAFTRTQSTYNLSLDCKNVHPLLTTATLHHWNLAYAVLPVVINHGSSPQILSNDRTGVKLWAHSRIMNRGHGLMVQADLAPSPFPSSWKKSLPVGLDYSLAEPILKELLCIQVWFHHRLFFFFSRLSIMVYISYLPSNKMLSNNVQARQGFAHFEFKTHWTVYQFRHFKLNTICHGAKGK